MGTALTKLASNAVGAALTLETDSTDPAATPLEFRTETPSQAPMKVGPSAKVENLDADKLDGKDSGRIGVNGAEQVASTSGMDSTDPKTVNATCPDGKIALAGGARVQGNFRNIALHESHQNFADPRQWHTSAHEVNPTADVWLLETYAVCVLAGPPQSPVD